jgi:hypothetical protein
MNSKWSHDYCDVCGLCEQGFGLELCYHFIHPDSKKEGCLCKQHLYLCPVEIERNE